MPKTKTPKISKPKILYEVLLAGEPTARKTICIKASSPEEAIGLAAKKKVTVSVRAALRPVAVDEAKYASEAGEYRYDPWCICAGCGLGVLHGHEVEGFPEGAFKFAYVGNEHSPQMICYACAQERQELHTHGGPCLAEDRKTGPSCQYCITGKDNNSDV